MKLSVILLDAAGVELLVVVPALFILHFAFTLAVEGYVLLKFAISESYKKAIYLAFLANLASFLVGLLTIGFMKDLVRSVGGGEYWSFYMAITIYFLETLLVEGLVLRLLQKNTSITHFIGALLTMNVITYLILLGIFSML